MENLKNEIMKTTTGMLIRKPIHEVFKAFINPEITTKFWFTKSSGKLEQGKHIEWTWEMYGVSVAVFVKEIIPNEKIVIEWGNNPRKSTVTWTFKHLDEKGTYVEINNNGFSGDTDELVAQVKDSTKGFTFLLAGLKAYLEHGIQLNLVADAFPGK